MVDSIIIAVKNVFRGLGSFLPLLQEFYREFGLHLSQQEAFILTGALIGIVVGFLIRMVTNK